jgi:hypothetical protein
MVQDFERKRLREKQVITVREAKSHFWAPFSWRLHSVIFENSFTGFQISIPEPSVLPLGSAWDDNISSAP